MDIIFLQEVRISSEQIEQQLRGFKASVNMDENQPLKPGIAIVWREALPVADVSPLTLCRLQVATLGPYKLMNIYAPSGSDKKHERNVFFGQDIFEALHLDCQSRWVVGGDHNSVLKIIDVDGGVGFSHKRCPALEDLVKAAKFVDTFREKFPNKEEFTFFRAGCAPSRLDRFYISAEFMSEVHSVSHVASLSDHCGVKLSMMMHVDRVALPTSRRRTYWKLNSSILGDQEFLPSFISLWKNILSYRQNFPDIAEWWDKMAKPQIKDFLLVFQFRGAEGEPTLRSSCFHV